MKKTISVVLTSVAILIFVISIVVMLVGTRAIKQNEPLFIFGYSFSIVPTDSMVGDHPDSLDPWDIAIIRQASFEEIEIGDVIVFQSEINNRPILIIHRVVGLHPNGGYETQGDHNASVDLNPVTEANFKAIYTGKITFLKPIARLAAVQKNVVFGILSVLLLGMIVSETIHIIKVMKTTQEEKLKKEHEEKIKEALYQEVLEEELNKKKTNES